MNHLHFRTIECVAQVQQILAAEVDAVDTVDPIQKIQQVLASLGHSLDAKVAYIVSYHHGYTKCGVVYEWRPDGSQALPGKVGGTANFNQSFFYDQPNQKALIEPLVFQGRWVASIALSLPDDSEDEHAPEVLRLCSFVGSLLAPFWHSHLEAIRAKAPPAQELTLSDEHVSKSTEHIHVLVVEDGEMNRIVMSRIIERLGAVAHVVETGKAGVEICQQRKFDVIFMDLNMPLMDGFDATRQVVTSCPLNAFTPIIAVTADTTSGIERRCKKIGIKQYLSKPVDVKQIADVLDAL